MSDGVVFAGTASDLRKISPVFGKPHAIRLVSVRPPGETAARQALLGSICIIAATFTAGVAFQLRFNLATAGSLEILLVVLAALRWGFLQATLVSLTSVVCLNYLFTAPLFQFSVADSQNLISLITFEATALLVSRLSSEVRLHAAEVEAERKRNSKLYQLSRAILLIDVRQSAVSQVSELVHEVIEVEHAEIWSIYEEDESASRSPQSVAKGSAYETYLTGKDINDPAGRTTQRLLRSGTTVIGGMVLRGWSSDSALSDAVASLVAIALERVRAIARETRAEAERNVEQLRTAVLDSLAHSYKTPLTAIQTASSGLLAIRKMTPTQVELVTIIDDQTTVLAQLTTRLLQTATLEGQQVRLRRKSTHLLDLIREVETEQDESIQKRIKVRSSPELQPVELDADLIKLALTQLIDNAAKYAAMERSIEVSITQDAFESIFAVSNEGAPIPPEEKLRLFQRFYRGLASARGPAGTGLGLSIVKKSAEAHSGRAWIDSENGVNRFSISIPRFRETTVE